MNNYLNFNGYNHPELLNYLSDSGIFPVCSFLNEICGRFRYEPARPVKGYSILEFEEGILKINTVVQNLLPFNPAISSGCLFYHCCLNSVEDDGTVSVSLPIGVLGINSFGCGQTFGQVAWEQLSGANRQISEWNVITVTAESRGVSLVSGGELILAGTIPKRIVKAESF